MNTRPTREVLRANIAVAKKIHKKLLKGQTPEKIARIVGVDKSFVTQIKDHFKL